MELTTLLFGFAAIGAVFILVLLIVAWRERRVPRAFDAITGRANTELFMRAGRRRVRDLTDLFDVIDRAGVQRRVVNLCVDDDRGPISHRGFLRLGRPNTLRINIGMPLSESLVVNAEAFPELRLDTVEGNWIDVVVSSQELRIGTPPLGHGPYSIFLPVIGASWVCQCDPGSPHRCDPDECQDFLEIGFASTISSGIARMRVSFYSRRNLLQSFLLRLAVGEGAGECVAEMDYHISPHFENPDQLPERALNILTNRSDEATHLLVVHFKDVAERLNSAFEVYVSEHTLGATARLARSALQEIHRRKIDGGLLTAPRFENLYDTNNRKTRAGLEGDLRKLAPVGRDLLLCIAPDTSQRSALRSVLKQPDAAIQVGRPGRADVFFPWAAVYDVPLGEDPRHYKLCPGVEALLDESRLLPASCPQESHHIENVLCPYGFWGFRHRIEVPPRPPDGHQIRLKIPTASRRFVLAHHNDFAKHNHLANLAWKGFTSQPHVSSLAALREALDQDALEVLYFFAHGFYQQQPGGSRKVLLQIGADEVFGPGDLDAWSEGWDRTAHWSSTAPLVVANGCHTVEEVPETIVSLADSFASVAAAGMLGTEVPVSPNVAAEFAEAFFASFMTGTRLSEALRNARLRFLAKGNLMGLAYTAYASGDLCLVDHASHLGD